jgi:hypothetical protein
LVVRRAFKTAFGRQQCLSPWHTTNDARRATVLNTQRFADTFAAQHPVKNHPRNKDRGK